MDSNPLQQLLQAVTPFVGVQQRRKSQTSALPELLQQQGPLTDVDRKHIGQMMSVERRQPIYDPSQVRSDMDPVQDRMRRQMALQTGQSFPRPQLPAIAQPSGDKRTQGIEELIGQLISEMQRRANAFSQKTVNRNANETPFSGIMSRLFDGQSK